MKTDLFYLALTAMLTASLWFPYVVAQFRTNGPLRPRNYVDPLLPKASLFGERAHRAYLNAVEVFGPFAALIVVTNLAGKADNVTGICAMAFFWLRLAHATVFWLAIPYVRTLLFVAAFAVEAALFWRLLA